LQANPSADWLESPPNVLLENPPNVWLENPPNVWLENPPNFWLENLPNVWLEIRQMSGWKITQSGIFLIWKQTQILQYTSFWDNTFWCILPLKFHAKHKLLCRKLMINSKCSIIAIIYGHVMFSVRGKSLNFNCFVFERQAHIQR